jgi:hypothetical protein
MDPKLKSSTPVWDELELDMHGYFIELESTLRLRRTNESVLFAFDAVCSILDCWPTLKERRTKTRLINFYNIPNNNMEIPYTDILIPNQSKTRTSHSKTFREE